MSIGIGDALGKSFGFAKNNTLGHILRWIALAILMCIPIVNWLVSGIFLKAFRNEETNFSNAGKSFVQGLLAWVITLIYNIITFIVAMIFGLGGIISGAFGLVGTTNGNIFEVIAGFAGAIGGIIITLVVLIIISLIMTPALINFARSGKFGSAFKFGEIFGMIGKLGWGKYILAWIVLIVIAIVIGLVIGLIGMIPVAGGIISLILMLLAIPFLTIWEYNYFATLLE